MTPIIREYKWGEYTARTYGEIMTIYKNGKTVMQVPQFYNKAEIMEILQKMPEYEKAIKKAKLVEEILDE